MASTAAAATARPSIAQTTRRQYGRTNGHMNWMTAAREFVDALTGEVGAEISVGTVRICGRILDLKVAD